MGIELEKAARDAVARRLSAWFRDELEVELGGMQAVLLIDFLAETLGPHFYNQGLYDARALLQTKLEAVADGLYELEKRAKL